MLVTITLIAVVLAQTPDPLSGGAGWIGAGLLGAVLSWLLLIHLPNKDKQLDKVYSDKDRQAKETSDQHKRVIEALVTKHEAAVKQVVDHCDGELTAEREAAERRHKEQMDEFGRLHDDLRDQVHAMRGLFQMVTNRTRLADAMQSVEMPAWTKTLSGILTSWNDAAEECLGWRSNEIVGKSVYDTVIPPERKAEEQDVLARIAAGESVREYQTERNHRDGRKIRLWVVTSPIINRDGLIIGVSTFARLR